MGDVRAFYLRDGKTIGGLEVFIEATTEQNWLRSSLGAVQNGLYRLAVFALDAEGEWPESLAPLFVIADALERNFSNVEHYGENRPGLFTYSGKPLLPEPIFTYWDLWQFGVTGEEELKGFLRRCGLPPKTSNSELLLATGLLLVDVAVKACNEGRDSFAAHLMFQATECESHARLYFLMKEPRDQTKAAIREMLSLAGKRSGVVRREQARASPIRVQQLAAQLLKEGKASRDLAAIVAERLNISPDYARRLMKRKTT